MIDGSQKRNRLSGFVGDAFKELAFRVRVEIHICYWPAVIGPYREKL